ncbi:MAG: TGS domain-containing protein [Pseudomonadota bacterium]
MKQKGIRLAEAMDVISFRLIADSIDDCYRALGLVHAAYKPLPKRFKDYIAVPKANGYQSLHTVLAGPHGIPIEVQIRTQWMDHVAESGIAAHWLYQSTDVSNASKEAQQACAWVDELVGIRDAVDTTREYLDQVKFDLEPSEVYVFTPKGKIFALPFGATAVDFAYLVHTDIGHRCESARIDRRMSPLSTRLSSGQTIEIITTADAVPNPAWLNFVVTAKARTSIREWLRRQKAEQAQKLGQKLLEAALASVGVSPTSLTPEHIATACRHAHVASYAALVEAIGLGQQFAALVAPHFLPQQSVDALPVVKPSLVIEGTEGIVVHYATCCYPIPGDAVVGFLTGEGLLVHQESCAHIEQRLNTPEKCVFLSWADQVVGEFPVEVRFDLDNSPGALALVTTIIAEANANIIAVRLDEKERHYSSVMLVMTVHNRYHLSKIIRRLRNNTVVSRIIRT